MRLSRCLRPVLQSLRENREMPCIRQRKGKTVKADIAHFRMPRYREIPNIGLYLDQTIKYLNVILQPLGCVEATPSMVSNYVKKGYIAKPVKKLYDERQIAYLLIIMITKLVLSMENIETLLKRQDTGDFAETYNWFCELFEQKLLESFGMIPPSGPVSAGLGSVNPGSTGSVSADAASAGSVSAASASAGSVSRGSVYSDAVSAGSGSIGDNAAAGHKNLPGGTFSAGGNYPSAGNAAPNPFMGKAAAQNPFMGNVPDESLLITQGTALQSEDFSARKLLLSVVTTASNTIYINHCFELMKE